MGKKVESLINKSKNSFERFWLAYIMLAASVLLQFVLIFITVDSKSETDENTLILFGNMIYFTYLCYIGFVAVKLLEEKAKLSDNKKVVAYLSVVITTFLFTLFVIPNTLSDSLGGVNAFKLMVVLNIYSVLPIILPALLSKAEKDEDYWNLSRKIISAGFSSFIFSTILFLGLLLATVSAQTLLEISTSPEFFVYLAIFCYNIFGSIIYLSGLPKNVSKPFEIKNVSKSNIKINKYVFIPLLVIFGSILHLFAIRFVLSADDRPSNISVPTTTLFLLLGILSTYMLHPLQDKPKMGWVRNYIYAFVFSTIIPILLFFIGIGIRIDEYGFTLTRFQVLLLGISLVIGVAHLVLRKIFPLRMVAPVIASLFFIFTFFPFINAADIAKYSQSSRFISMLDNAGYIKSDGKIDTSKEFLYTSDMQLTFEYLGKNHDYSGIKKILTESQWKEIDFEYESYYYGSAHWSAFLDLFEEAENSESGYDPNEGYPTTPYQQSFKINSNSPDFFAISTVKNGVIFDLDAFSFSRFGEQYRPLVNGKYYNLTIVPMNDSLIVNVESTGEITTELNFDEIELDLNSYNQANVYQSELTYVNESFDNEYISKITIILDGINGYLDTDEEEISSITSYFGKVIIEFK